ncbi:MAG: ceramidase [Rickettsiales bacterium]|nr:ceramidase [Rickettsiales bacterium]
MVENPEVMQETTDLLQHVYGVCERTTPYWYGEPLNTLSNLLFMLVAVIIYKHYHKHPDLKDRKILDIHAMTFLIFAIGIFSSIFHMNPNPLTELMDIVPIVLFINIFFFSITVRIGKTNAFQTVVCYVAFLGFTHILISQFPNAMNDSISYLSSMTALVAIAIYLHMKRRPSSHQFLLGALVGIISLFFRAIDNAVCEQIPFGTHFMWHSMNALLLYILMKQVIRNVNREARLQRMGIHD